MARGKREGRGTGRGGGRKARVRGERSSRRGRKGKRTKDMVRIARERMDHLMDLSADVAKGGDLEKADRYSGLARRIGMRYNVRMRPAHRRLICRRCGAFLLPSRTVTVRVRRGRRIATCRRCSNIERLPIARRRVARDRRDLRDNGPMDDGD